MLLNLKEDHGSVTGGISSHLRPVLCVGLLVKMISRRLSCEKSSKNKKGITEMDVQPMLGLSLIYLFFFFVLVKLCQGVGIIFS